MSGDYHDPKTGRITRIGQKETPKIYWLELPQPNTRLIALQACDQLVAAMNKINALYEKEQITRTQRDELVVDIGAAMRTMQKLMPVNEEPQSPPAIIITKTLGINLRTDYQASIEGEPGKREVRRTPGEAIEELHKSFPEVFGQVKYDYNNHEY